MLWYPIGVRIRFLDSRSTSKYLIWIRSSAESPCVNLSLIFIRISLLSLCHHSSLSIKCILKISQSLNQMLTSKHKSYTCLKLLVWTCANFEIQPSLVILLKQLYINSTTKVIKGSCRENAKKISRKYPDCLKNIVWSFIIMLPLPKWNFYLYSKYEVWPLIKVVEPV